MSQPPESSWPTMNEGKPSSSGWPTVGSPTAPATQPAADPLAVQRATLAPVALPGREAAPDAATTAAPVAAPQSGSMAAAEPAHPIPCPHCGTTVQSYESFCESCGGTLVPTTAQPPSPLDDELNLDGPLSVPTLETDSVAEMNEPASRSCSECGGVVGPDGYCSVCGAKATITRDHWTETPSSWVGGCTDRGQRHYRNEDAIALAADAEPGSRGVLVVCDGVSSSQDSDRGSLAAARAARDALRQITIDQANPDAVVAEALGAAASAAQEAIVAATDPASTNAASATFVACVTFANRIWLGTLGDSRVYWIADDPARAQLLSLDDSIAQQRIALGVPREQAENGPGAHAITRWLGRDADDVSPRTTVFAPTEPGYLLACTDGLWNYCSEPEPLAALVASQVRSAPDATPTQLAEMLVSWANAQGGKDNISVALARLDATSAGSASSTSPTLPLEMKE